MKRILFLSSIKTHFRYLLPISTSLRDKGFQCIFVFDPYAWPSRDEEDFCHRQGFSFWSMTRVSPNLAFNAQPGYWQRMTHRFFERGFAFSFRVAIVGDLIKAWSSHRYAKKVLESISPDALVTAEDTGYIAPYFISICQRKNIRSVVCPFSLANQEEYIYSRLNNPKYMVKRRNVLKRLYLAVSPKWIRHANPKNIMLSSFTHCIIADILGTAPENPWTICGGNSDKIVVESQFVKDYYVRSNAKSHKMFIGSPFLSEAGIRRDSNPAAFLEAERKKSNQTWVLISIPPDHLNNRLFQSFEDMFVGFIRLTSRRNVRLLISLHPRIDRRLISRLTEDIKAKITEIEISQLMPMVDLFVASASASIRFALAAKKFSINFNIYSLPFTEYSQLSVVKEVSDTVSFSKAYDEFLGAGPPHELSAKLYSKYPSDYFIGSSDGVADALEKIII